ncbi:MAG: hypothetical protein R3E01_15710 [Pirellulaceae bacterium]|nr:hypothetical protein [Planctomycetales bacterium]
MTRNASVIAVVAACVALSAIAFAVGDTDTGGEANVDTRADRLKGAVVERPSISKDYGGYLLKAPDFGEFQRRMRELELYPNRLSELEEQMTVISQGIEDTQASDNNELLGALNLKYNDVNSDYRILRNLNRKSYYYRVVHVGQDFIELQDAHEGGATKLIPTNRIAEVTNLVESLGQRTVAELFTASCESAKTTSNWSTSTNRAQQS